MYKHFLIPTDGSEPSEAAVDAALKLAAETGAKVLALNIQMPFVPPAFAEMPIAAPFTDAEYEKAVMQASERVLASVLVEAQGTGRHPELVGEVGNGELVPLQRVRLIEVTGVASLNRGRNVSRCGSLL